MNVFALRHEMMHVCNTVLEQLIVGSSGLLEAIAEILIVLNVMTRALFWFESFYSLYWN